MPTDPLLMRRQSGSDGDLPADVLRRVGGREEGDELSSASTRGIEAGAGIGEGVGAGVEAWVVDVAGRVREKGQDRDRQPEQASEVAYLAGEWNRSKRRTWAHWTPFSQM
jgi:hypothetical protein